MIQDTIAVGMLVEHPLWGRGKAVEVRSSNVVVHFPSLVSSEQGPRRRLQLATAQLTLAAVQTDPALDRVAVGPGRPKKPKPVAAGPARAHAQSARPLEFAIEGFRKDYPGLFRDPKLAKGELSHKREAHEKFVELFGHGRGRQLLDSGAFAEITAGLVGLYQATDIPHRFEKLAATNGLKDGPAAGRLLTAALDFVDAPAAETFQALGEAIANLPAPSKGSRVLTWPNVTLVPFLADPSRFMVLKPAIVQQTAARMSFDLVYSATPRWQCYEALQRMVTQLLETLRALGANDFVDVQAFMWVTRGLE
jgi:hypothetical protein